MTSRMEYVSLSESTASVQVDQVYIHLKSGQVVRLTASDLDSINQAQWLIENENRNLRRKALYGE